MSDDESGLIPYTHWAYFDDRAAADACGRELDERFNCLAAVDRSYDDMDWLLRAARTVSLDWPNGWHLEIKEVVERHGGRYDGGESGWMEFTPEGVVYLGAGEDA